MAKKPIIDFDEAKLRRDLEAAAKRKKDRSVKVLTDIQQPLKERITQLAPVGADADPEGHIIDSITVDVVDRPSGPQLIARVHNEHALPNEFGTSHMPARPFMRPAIAEVPNRIKRR